MGIRVTCPLCAATVDAPFDTAGNTAPCPKCGATVSVPRLDRLTSGIGTTRTLPTTTKATNPPNRSLVTSPAFGLAVVAALGLVGMLLILVYSFMGNVRSGSPAQLVNTCSFCVSPFVYSFVAFGAAMMHGLRNRTWAFVAAILAMLPVGPVCVIGLPVGIWALVVLSRDDVGALFDSEQRNRRTGY